MTNGHGSRFHLRFREFFEFLEYLSQRILILGIVILSSRYVRDAREHFLVQCRTDRFPGLIEEILFLTEPIRHIEFRSGGISDTERVDFHILLLCKFRCYRRIDPHIGLAVRQHNDDFFSFPIRTIFFIPHQSIERDEESVSHSRSRESRDILADGVGRHLLHCIYESGVIKRERSGEERFSREKHNGETIARETTHEIAHHPFRHFDTVRLNILREHGLRDIKHDGDIDSLLGNLCPNRRTHGIRENTDEEGKYNYFQKKWQVKVLPLTLLVDFLEESRTPEIDSLFPRTKIYPDKNRDEEEEEKEVWREKGHGK